jgi:exportin-T
MQRLLSPHIEHLTLLCQHQHQHQQQAAANGSAASVGMGGGGCTLPGLSKPIDDTSARQLEMARAAEAAFHISSVAVVSKGVPSLPIDPPLVRDYFCQATRVSLTAMATFVNASEVRTKAMMLLHRMVETMGEELLVFMPPSDATLIQLLAAADAKELIELVTLVNQLTLKFRDKLGGALTSLFSALAVATFGHLSQLDAAIASSSSASIGAAGPASDDVRERRNLLRSFYSLLHSLVHSELVGVLTSPENSAHTAPALRILLTGCIEGPDLTLQRQCFLILERLVNVWVGTIPGFDVYVLQEVLPVCFSAPAQPHFSLKDAAATQLLETSASLQKTILAKQPNELVAHLRDRLLPSLGCSAEFAAEYVRQLCEGDVRQLRDFMRAQFGTGGR